MTELASFLGALAAVDIWFRNDEGRLRYQAPQGVLTPFLRTALAEHREDLLSILAVPPVPPVPREDGPGWKRFSFPSRGQKALWYEHRLDPSGAAYNVALAAKIVSPVDAHRLERALQRCLDRHAALRVTFPEWNGEPVQLVDKEQSLTFNRIDAEGWSAQRLESRLAEELARPFDLIRGPLFRTLFFDRSDRPWLVLTIHHIVFDLWSFRVLLDDLGAFYDSESGAGAEPPPLAFEYPDYVLWQERELAGPRGERLWAYWRERLAGTPPPLELPADRPRPPFRSGRGATLLFPVDGTLTASLRGFSRERGLTLYSTVLAGFLALLRRYTGQTDLAVGSAVAGRSLPALEPLAGYFVNMLVLRSDFRGERGDPSFAALAADTSGMVAGALDHQDFPFPLLVERLGLPRTGRSPVYDVTYALQPAHVDLRGGQAGGAEVVVRAGSLELELIEVPQQQGQTDLSLRLFDRGATLAGWLQYDPDLFDDATVSRWRRHLEALLAAAVANPEAGIGDLGLLSPAERHQLLAEWNDTASRRPREETLAEAFAARVAATPDAVAVVFGSAVLTYAGLDARAERVARRLARLGVGCDDRVGLVAGRSLEMIVGLLGVIKAGAGYVALSPEDPPERLGDLLAGAGVAAILTQEALRDRLDEVWRGRPVIGLDLDDDRDDPVPPVPTARALPSSLAYIAFTSGSSGRPKGVAVPQRAVLRLVRDHGFADLGPGQVFLQLSPLAFDASTLEVWGPLLNGGRLVVMPPGTPSLEEVAEAVERHGVTLLWLTAGLFHAMVEGPLERLASLRQLVAGGDALSPRHVRETLARLPGLRLVNGYGPTENTTFTCCGAVAGTVDTDRPVPLGRPIADTRAVLLDEGGRPVPLGAAGELHAGGDGLARGYWGQPDRTAERFVPDPFSGSPGARLYRTGDRARFLPDGRVEFLGRQDRQVKIRGFRVEPGEVEAALGGHPGVAEAAVDTRLDAAGERVLVAWVVPRAEAAGTAAGTAEELRSWLASRLPAALVPSAILDVEALPRTPNGKVDRRDLPTPAWGGAGSAEDRRPLTPSEELAAEVWTDVLGLERVGPQDDFFALGGHSLLAVRVLSRVRSTLGVELSIRDLLESPTLAGFAGRLREALAGRTAGEPSAARPAPRQGLEGLPLSFAQQRLWFLDQLEGGSPLYNIAACFGLEGVLSPGALIDAFAALVDRHEALRTSFRVVDGEPAQDVAEGLPLAIALITRVDLGALPAGRRSAELARLAAEEAERPFDLGRAPLLRVRLVRLARQEHAVLLTLHHIVGDGASLDILFRELAELYDARLRGRGSSLPGPAEPGYRYPDFVAWQRERLQGPALEERLAPWRARLVPVPPPEDTTTGRERPWLIIIGPLASGDGPAAAASPAAVPALTNSRRFMGDMVAYYNGFFAQTFLPVMTRQISLDTIRDAATVIYDVAVRTPLVRLDVPGLEAGGVEVFLKLESLQPIGSFKIRGAYNAVRHLSPAELAGGVWTVSAGNAAQGVALAARRAGAACSVMVMDTAPETKLRSIERLGATIVQRPYDECWRTVEEHRSDRMTGRFVHPFDDDLFISGNGTIGLEIVEDLPDVDAVIAPLGGGGLLAGVAAALRELRPEAKVYAAEPETAAPLALSYERGRASVFEAWQTSFVDGAGGRSVLPSMWPLLRDLVSGSIVVSLDDAAAAMRRVADRVHVIMEGAAACAVAAVTSEEFARRGHRKVVAIVSGGNIDLARFAQLTGACR